jgi:ribosome maturation factor RimP
MQPLEHIRAIAERVAASRGLEIWDIQSRREAIGHVVRVFIDRPGPAATAEESVSIEDCEQVNREISTILDVEDPLPFTYTLEVSSPGLDRPLRTIEDYRRFAGRLAKVVVSEAVDNQKAFEGHLRGVEHDTALGSTALGGTALGATALGGTVLLEAPNGRMHRLPMRLITRGRLEVEF